MRSPAGIVGGMGCEGVRQAWQRRSSLMTIFGKFGAALARAGIVVSSDGSGGCPPVISKNGRLGNLAVPAGAGGELLLRRVLAQKLAERRRVSADDYRARLYGEVELAAGRYRHLGQPLHHPFRHRLRL